IPVTMWFVLAWWLVLDGRTLSVALAGLATSAAILTRPNLAPLAGVLFLFAAREQPRVARAFAYALGALPGVLAVAAINNQLYGNAAMSGYGSLRELFDWSNVGPNLQRYPVWLVQLHTPAILLSLAAPFVAEREPDTRPSIVSPRVVAVWMIAYGVLL